MTAEATDNPWKNWAPATCLPDRCFCESPRAGLIAQPANTWSNALFVIVGFLILWRAGRDRAEKRFGNVMASNSFYPDVYAFAIILLGFSSAFYHASLTKIGGALDNWGMYLVVTFLILYNLSRRYRVSEGTFGTIFVLLNIPLLIFAYWDPAYYTRWVFAALIGVVALTEYQARQRGKQTLDLRYFWGALGTLALAFLIWILDIEKIVCNPTSLLQLHAFWHILTAIAVGLMYLYYRSDQAVEKTGRT